MFEERFGTICEVDFSLSYNQFAIITFTEASSVSNILNEFIFDGILTIDGTDILITCSKVNNPNPFIGNKYNNWNSSKKQRSVFPKRLSNLPIEFIPVLNDKDILLPNLHYFLNLNNKIIWDFYQILDKYGNKYTIENVLTNYNEMISEYEESIKNYNNKIINMKSK